MLLWNGLLSSYARFIFFSFWNPNILFLPMFQLVCHASLFYFKDQSGRQRQSGVCIETRPACFPHGTHDTCFWFRLVWFFTSLLFASFHAHNLLAFRHTCTAGGAAICTGGRHTGSPAKHTHTHTHGHADSFLGWKISWILGFFLLLVEERKGGLENIVVFFFHFNWGFFDTIWKLQPLGHKKDYMPSSVQTILFWVLIFFKSKKKQKM